MKLCGKHDCIVGATFSQTDDEMRDPLSGCGFVKKQLFFWWLHVLQPVSTPRVKICYEWR